MRADRIVEVLLAALAAVVFALVLAASTTWPTAGVIAAALAVGVLTGAVAHAIAAASAGLAGRVAVGVAVGAVLGELAAMVVFGGAIDAELTRQASPRTELAAASLQQTRQARAGLDDAVARAEQRRDEALVVARCEVNPSADCPQNRITGRPGSGPGARTAEDFLTDSDRALDTAIAERDSRAAILDAEVAVWEQAVADSRDGMLTAGIGSRWQAMNAYTLDHPGPLVLRALVAALCMLLTLLPMLLRRWRGATTQDAESAADTAIAVKRAEVRAQVDQLWAEQELHSARMAVEAQNAIDAERQRRRVAEALDPPEPSEAAPAALPVASSREPEAAKELEPHRGGGLPIIPDVTRAAVRFIRPFVPPIVAGAIDSATKPIRQVFEETEEFHFTMRRTHRVTVESEGVEQPGRVTAEREWVDVSRPRIESRRGVVLDGSDGHREIGEGGPTGRDDGAPRQLPPA
ncbi:DUF4407 domain-containing protein [Mycolicibacterium sp. P9-22]|uniref:DUF4407 domain-containing protein n=1 Tax=Mycolicibacterium sp. P9-22 TaxID=2024613 RepID=UPI001883EC57|nr:DUF4407 domain-containing protein [Mycolicibacterium sp. P9-22]